MLVPGLLSLMMAGCLVHPAAVYCTACRWGLKMGIDKSAVKQSFFYLKKLILIKIYTDGSSKGNPGPGGYGTILQYQGHSRELAAGFGLTTNNRMELLAVIAGLEALKKKGQQVVVYSDSKYVVDAVRKGWLVAWLKKDFKKKKNADLWRRFWRVYQRHQVTFCWLKGHAGHPENERCDVLATQSAQQKGLAVDQGYLDSVKAGT